MASSWKEVQARGCGWRILGRNVHTNVHGCLCCVCPVSRHSTCLLPSSGQPWGLQAREWRGRPAPRGWAWDPGPGEPLEAVPGGREDCALPAERRVHEGAATQSRLPPGSGERWYTGWGHCGHFSVGKEGSWCGLQPWGSGEAGSWRPRWTSELLRHGPPYCPCGSPRILPMGTCHQPLLFPSPYSEKERCAFLDPLLPPTHLLAAGHWPRHHESGAPEIE